MTFVSDNRFLFMWPLGYLISASCSVTGLVKCVWGKQALCVGSLCWRGQNEPLALPAVALETHWWPKDTPERKHGSCWVACPAHSLPKLIDGQKTPLLEHFLPQSSLDVQYFWNSNSFSCSLQKHLFQRTEFPIPARMERPVYICQ